MALRFGQTEVVAPFDCLRPRTKKECTRCEVCGRHFHAACDERLRQEFAVANVSQIDIAIDLDATPGLPAPRAEETVDNGVGNNCTAVCFPCGDPENIEYVTRSMRMVYVTFV